VYIKPIQCYIIKSVFSCFSQQLYLPIIIVWQRASLDKFWRHLDQVPPKRWPGCQVWFHSGPDRNRRLGSVHDIREVHPLYSVVLNRCGHWGLLSAASVDARWDWNLSTARICCCAPCCSVSGRRHRQLLRQTRRSGVRTKGRKNGLPKVPTDSYRPCYGTKQF